MYFCTLYPSIGPKERSRQASDRLPLVSNFLTNFWMQHFDGARLSPNSVRNAVWHTLNELVSQYLQKINPRFSTVYIDNSLGPLARDSLCIRTQSVPRCKHSPPRLYKTNLLMLCKAKVAVCCVIHTKHINAMWDPCGIYECSTPVFLNHCETAAR